MKKINNRESQYDIADIFLARYSPRAMSGETLSEVELMTLFEAARWAPSASNFQPWRFLYAEHGTPDFDLFLSFLMPGNQTWCKNAGALVIILSKNVRDDGGVNATHSFDAGNAFENLALQGAEMGLVVHPMAGYNAEPLRKELNIPEAYSIEAMVAIGKPGKIEDLPEPLQSREAPSTRKELSEIVFLGKDGAAKL